ncbi:hypothetical protein [Actinomadura sp. K4S16]|uniref:hypothetical protein n=1 Tax=Actinomadura sp. K4S16 TaxID=1316147 RepID=UPI0011EBB2D0|nr:hypothetical protein [Actinomadura sp. K4S16]
MSVDDIDLADIPRIPEPTEPAKIEMVPLFVMGDDVYEMPKKPPAGLALEYLEKQVEDGPDAAAMWVMVEVLGEEVYTMLKDHPSLDFDQFNDIFERLEKNLLGGKGQKANRAQRGVRRRPASKKPRGS